MRAFFPTAFIALLAATPALADPPHPKGLAAYCPEALGEGANTVSAQGQPVGRVGDGECVMAVEGSPNVFVEGLPALRVGDKVVCRNGKQGVIVGGASTVFVNGRPLAGAGSRVVGCN